MKKIVVLCCSAAAVLAAMGYDVRLRAVDPANEPEAFATVRIFNADSASVAVGVADSLGVFNTSLDSVGNYVVSLTNASGQGYASKPFELSGGQTFTDLGDIVVGQAENLAEIVVTAQKPLVTRLIDRIGYDVQADPDSRSITLQDMMRRVPLISVDAEGNIQVNGSSNFRIFKNGRPSNSLSNNAKDLLAAIPASTIKTIEVITEPGAKYDAEGIGAILNIVTVEGSAVKGVLGNVSVDYSSNSPVPRANAFVTTQIDKVTISVNGCYNNKPGNRVGSEGENTYNNGNTTRWNSRGRQHINFGWFGAEASYEINRKNLLTAELDGWAFSSKTRYSDNSTTMLDPDGQVIMSYNSNVPYGKTKYLDFNGAVNYQLSTDRAGETFTASYRISNTATDSRTDTRYTDIVGTRFDYTGIDNTSNQHFIENTFQLDWVRPFADIHSIETGAKYVHRSNHADGSNDYIGVEKIDNEYRHLTDIAAIYAQYTVTIKKVSLRAGLRYEYSRLKSEFPDGTRKDFDSDLSDFVPSASAAWTINDANSLNLSYAQRINRPGISYLDPTYNYSPTTISYGNPDLESAHNSSLTLRYTFVKPKVNFSLSASYMFDNSGITSYSFVDKDGYVNNTYDNIGRQRDLSFGGYMQWTATDKTRVNFNFGVSRESYSQQGMHLARWGGYGFLRLSQDLPWKLRVEGFLNGYIPGASDVYSYMKMDAVNFWGLSLSRSFLKQDRLRVRLFANNIIGSDRRYMTSHTVNGDVLGKTWTWYDRMRSFGISVSYRFGSLNAYVKKTNAAISNDDIVGGQSRQGAN